MANTQQEFVKMVRYWTRQSQTRIFGLGLEHGRERLSEEEYH